MSSRRTVKARRSSNESAFLDAMAKLNYQASVFSKQKLSEGIPEDSHYAAFAENYM